jgi:hypothetical protein
MNLLSVASLAILMTACMTQPTYTKKEQKFKKPKKAISNYEKEFSKLNVMLRKIYHNDKTKLQVASVSNATTGNLQGDIKHFLEKPLIRYLHNYSLIAYDPMYDQNRQALGAGNIHTWGEFVIVGEISQYDKAVYSEGSGIDVDGEFGSGEGFTTATASMSDGFSKSMITVDLKIKDSQGVYDKVASNTIELIQKNKSTNIGIYLNSIGLGLSKSANMKQSTDQALRLVSEYSLIQLIGRFEQLPYWKCFSPELESDQEVINAWIAEFNRSAENNYSIRLLENFLIARYDAPFVNVNNKFDNNEIRTLIAIKKYFRIKEDIFNTASFYVELQENVPYFQDINLFKDIPYEKLQKKQNRQQKRKDAVNKKTSKKKILKKNEDTERLIILTPSLNTTQHVVHHVEEDNDFFKTNKKVRVYKNIGNNQIDIGISR